MRTYKRCLRIQGLRWRCCRLKDEKYDAICKKLGFEPRNYTVPDFETEDDSWESPFKILTVEEIDYLYKNGYLNSK